MSQQAQKRLSTAELNLKTLPDKNSTTNFNGFFEYLEVSIIWFKQVSVGSEMSQHNLVILKTLLGACTSTYFNDFFEYL